MTHVRALPLLITTFALVLLLPGVLLAEETKDFADAGFSWTIPDGWQWMEVSSNDENAGYLARAAYGARDAYVVLSARSIPNDDPNFLREHTEEVRQNIAAGLGEARSSVTEGSLAGVKGTLIKIRGKNRRDVQVVVRIYGIQSGNRIHQIFMEFVNGAEAKFAKQADKARRGYKLKSGGGDEPADSELAEGLEPSETEEGGADEAEEEGDREGQGKAPGRDGNTLTFGQRNLRWSIPEGSPFEWGRVTSDQTIEAGVMCGAEATIELEVSEEAQARGAPTENTALVLLFVQKAQEGADAEGMVKHQGNHQMWEKNYFAKVDYGRFKTSDKIDVGNYTGAALMMAGTTEEGHARYLRIYAVVLKDTIYRWEVSLTGDRNVNDDFSEAVKELMKTVEFLNTTTWVRGPLAIRAVAPYDLERGTGVGKERPVRSMGFTAKKPKPFASVEFATGANWRLAWEMRSEDKQKYLYFDVQTWSERSLQGVRNFAEDRIKQREGEWKEGVDSAQTIKKGKTPYFKASFGKGKGLGYEFKGFLGEVPFIERGFVVKHKKYWYWFRYQIGGEDAEKIFKKEIKALRKAIKFTT